MSEQRAPQQSILTWVDGWMKREYFSDVSIPVPTVEDDRSNGVDTYKLSEIIALAVAAASLPESQPPLAEQVHAIMTARVEDVGMQFYAPAPESQPSPSGDAMDYEEEAATIIRWCEGVSPTSPAAVDMLADWLRSHDAKVSGQAEQRLREALTNIAALPTKDYEISGMDCGNTGDVYEDGWQAGAKCAAGLAEAALQESPSDK